MSEPTSDLCFECGGTCTVPSQVNDVEGNPTAVRNKDHAHGSQWCPTCKGKGHLQETPTLEEDVPGS